MIIYEFQYLALIIFIEQSRHLLLPLTVNFNNFNGQHQFSMLGGDSAANREIVVHHFSEAF